jgi:hypothetical protein
VLIVDRFHHILNRVAYFSGLKKSVVSGGRMAIVDIKRDAPDGPPPQFRCDADQIVGEMKEAGFELDAKHDFRGSAFWC